ncbi:exo-alpha-sialidase, partial [Trypanosoma cruzi]
ANTPLLGVSSSISPYQLRWTGQWHQKKMFAWELLSPSYFLMVALVSVDVVVLMCLPAALHPRRQAHWRIEGKFHSHDCCEAHLSEPAPSPLECQQHPASSSLALEARHPSTRGCATGRCSPSHECYRALLPPPTQEFETMWGLNSVISSWKSSHSPHPPHNPLRRISSIHPRTQSTPHHPIAVPNDVFCPALSREPLTNSESHR